MIYTALLLRGFSQRCTQSKSRLAQAQATPYQSPLDLWRIISMKIKSTLHQRLVDMWISHLLTRYAKYIESKQGYGVLEFGLTKAREGRYPMDSKSNSIRTVLSYINNRPRDTAQPDKPCQLSSGFVKRENIRM